MAARIGGGRGEWVAVGWSEGEPVELVRRAAWEEVSELARAQEARYGRITVEASESWDRWRPRR